MLYVIFGCAFLVGVAVGALLGSWAAGRDYRQAVRDLVNQVAELSKWPPAGLAEAPVVPQFGMPRPERYLRGGEEQLICNVGRECDGGELADGDLIYSIPVVNSEPGTVFVVCERCATRPQEVTS